MCLLDTLRSAQKIKTHVEQKIIADKKIILSYGIEQTFADTGSIVYKRRITTLYNGAFEPLSKCPSWMLISRDYGAAKRINGKAFNHYSPSNYKNIGTITFSEDTLALVFEKLFEIVNKKFDNAAKESLLHYRGLPVFLFDTIN